MSLQFDTWYDKKLKKISKLKEDLSEDPANYELRSRIKDEEKDLFDTLVRIGEVLEELDVKDSYSTDQWYD